MSWVSNSNPINRNNEHRSVMRKVEGGFYEKK
jgi:hypothetical protein